MINISVMMGMGVSGACGAMGTHSCGTGDCVMGSPFTITCAFPAFSLPKWLGKSTKQNKHTKRGVNDVGNKKNYSVNVFLIPVTLAWHIAVLKCMQDIAFSHKTLHHLSTG